MAPVRWQQAVFSLAAVLQVVPTMQVPQVIAMTVGPIASGVDLDIDRTTAWLRNGVRGRVAQRPVLGAYDDKK